MEVRAAVPADAPALGRVMVATWLTAHRGQVPDEAWQKRVDEWTPQVSARGWERLLNEVEAGELPRTVLLVVEGDAELDALALGGPVDEGAPPRSPGWTRCTCCPSVRAGGSDDCSSGGWPTS